MRYPRAHNGGHQAIFFYRFPIVAIASILHRISGVILFLCIPLLLWALSISLSGLHGFAQVMGFFNCMWVKVVAWLILTALGYHLFAGLKHLLADLGHCESWNGARAASVIVLILSLALAIILGVRIL